MSLDHDADAPSGPSEPFKGVDLNDSEAIAKIQLAGEDAVDETPSEAPVTEPSKAPEPITAPEASPIEEPAVAPESLDTFKPIEYEWDGKQFKAESQEDILNALRQSREFGRQTRFHADERQKFKGQMTDRDQEIALLKEYREKVNPLLEALKGSPETEAYVRQELGLDEVADPKRIADNERMSKIEMQLQARDRQDQMVNSTGVLHTTLRNQGVIAPPSREEMGMVEQYAEQNGISRDQLYSNPLILTGVYTTLVALDAIRPVLNQQAGAPPPAETIKQQAAATANLPPASSGAPTQPGPVNTEGMLPKEVLQAKFDAGEFAELGTPAEVAAAMGLKNR